MSGYTIDGFLHLASGQPIHVRALTSDKISQATLHARRYDLLTLFQSGRSHMVVLTAPAHPETPRMGSPNMSMELAASLKEMKASDTPPARTEEGSVMVVSAGENGHSNGPLSEVSILFWMEGGGGACLEESVDSSQWVQCACQVARFSYPNYYQSRAVLRLSCAQVSCDICLPWLAVSG